MSEDVGQIVRAVSFQDF